MYINPSETYHLVFAKICKHIVGAMVCNDVTITCNTIQPIVMGMGFNNTDDYVRNYPSKFDLESRGVLRVTDLCTIGERGFVNLDYFFRNIYFNLRSYDINDGWGDSETLFSERYDEILDDEPNGCMFIVSPKVKDLMKVKVLKPKSIRNRWFCTDWKEPKK